MKFISWVGVVFWFCLFFHFFKYLYKSVFIFFISRVIIKIKEKGVEKLNGFKEFATSSQNKEDKTEKGKAEYNGDIENP